MQEGFITYRGTVSAWQCDHMGHMNVMWYVGKFDEASWQALGVIGLTASRFRAEGLGMATVAQELTYKKELHAGDAVTIRTSVLAVGDKTVRVLHEMTHDETGDVAATTVIVGVHIDATTRRARPLPSDVRELAELRVRHHMDDGRCDHADVTSARPANNAT